MLGLAWLLYACFGLVIGTIPPLVDPIRQDLDISYGQMGLVLGVWQLVYIGTASPLGSFVDRLGIRRSLGVGIVVVWLSLVLRGLVVDFWTLTASVALFGLGGPIISIGAPKLVADWFDGRERGTAAGIYATGPMVGGILALSTAAGVVVPLTGSWRGVSVVYGAIVLVVAVAWWVLARESPRVPAAHTETARAGELAIFKGLLGLANIRIMLVVAVVVFLVNHGLNSWLPTLLQDKGLTLTQAGTWTAGATAAGIVGLLLIPRVAESGRRALVLGSLLVVGALGILAMAWLTGPLMLLGLMVSGVVRGPLMPVSTLVVMETRGVDSARVGAATGLFFASAEIGGFSGPFVLGLLRQATDSLTSGLVFLAAVSVVLVLLLPFLREEKSGVQPRSLK